MNKDDFILNCFLFALSMFGSFVFTAAGGTLYRVITREMPASSYLVVSFILGIIVFIMIKILINKDRS